MAEAVAVIKPDSVSPVEHLPPHLCLSFEGRREIYASCEPVELPPPSEGCTDPVDYWRELLSGGIIHPIMAEKYRILEQAHPAVTQLNDLLQPLLPRLFPERDFAADPVKFLWASVDNLMYLPGSNPTMVVVGTGILASPGGKGLCTLSGLAGGICHELRHEHFHRKFGPEHRNSALEESVADLADFQKLYDAGLCPADFAEYFRVRARSPRPSDALNALLSIIDVHPVDSLRVRTAEMVLYDFRRTHDNFDGIQESEEDRALFGEVLELARYARYESPFEIRLRERLYPRLPVEEKLEILAEEVRRSPHLTERTDFIAWKIRSLPFPGCLDNASPRFIHALDDLHEAIFDLKTQPVTIANSCRLDGMNKQNVVSRPLAMLYESAFSRGYPVRVFTRLKSMQDAVNAFLSSDSAAEASKFAQDIVQMDSELMKELTTDSRGGYSDEFQRTMLYGVPWDFSCDFEVNDIVPWQRLYEFARENSEYRDRIIQGLFQIGAEDHRLGAILSPSARYGFDDGYLSRLRVVGYGFPVCRLRITDHGRVSCIRGEYEDAGLQWRDSFLSNPQVRYLDSSFFTLAGFSPRLDVRALNFHSDIGTFCMYFRWQVQASHEYQQELVDYFHSLLEDPLIEKEEIKKNIRKLYQLYLSYKGYAAIFFDRDGEQGAIEAPLYRFMMEDPFNCFSLEWKINILAMNSCAGRSTLRGRRDETPELTQSHREGEAFHQPLREELHKLIPEIPRSGPGNWEQLNQMINWFDERFHLVNHPYDYPRPAIRLFIAMTESIRLAGEGILPAPSELGRVISAYGQDICWMRSSEHGCDETMYALFRPALGYPVNWPEDNKEALAAWKDLDDAGFFPGDERYDEIERILTSIESNHSPDVRYEELKFLFHNCLPPETEFQQRAVKLCSETVLEIMGGIDDGSDGYLEKFKDLCAPLFAGSPKGIQISLAENLLSVIESQAPVTFYVRSLLSEADEETLKSSNLWGILLNGTESVSELSLEERKGLLDFITGENSQAAIDSFIDKPSTDEVLRRIRYQSFLDLESHKTTSAAREGFLTSTMTVPPEIDIKSRRDRNRDILSRLHRNYWLAPLEAKILIALQLLIPVTATPNDEREAFDYVISKRFSGSPDVMRMLELGLDCYLSTLSAGDKAMLLTAILVSSSPYDSDAASRVGQIAARILPAMGPIEAKGSQAIHSHPGTQPEIAQDMAITTYLANPPSRIEQFAAMDAHTDQLVLDQLEHMGPLIGSGSFYFANDVKLKDGRQGVLRLLRRNAEQRADFGSAQLKKALADPRLEEAFGEDGVRTIRDILDRAEIMWAEEIDPDFIERSQSAMEGFCDGFKVAFNGKEFCFVPRRVLSVEGYGSVSSSECSLSTRIEGIHYVEMEKSGHKSEIAVAVCTRVLHAILNGEPFPTDLMGGNAKVNGDEIGMFDPGGMYLHCNDESDIPVIKDTMIMLLNGENSMAAISRKLNEKYGDLSTPEGQFMSALQKAILSLYDFIGDLPEGSMADIGRAALARLSSGRLKALNVPPLVIASLKLPNRVRLIGRTGKTKNKV